MYFTTISVQQLAVTKHESVVFAEANSSSSQQQLGESGGGTTSLEYCLKEHTREEVLDCANSWYCSNCKKHQQAKKMVKFWSSTLPQVLILVLKRFEFRDVSSLVGRQGMMYRDKIDTLVDFPLEGLDLAPFCGDPEALLADCLPLDGDCKEGRQGAEELLSAYCRDSSTVTSPRSTSASSSGASSSIEKSCTKYDLFAVCNHYGKMGFGHYTAYARDWLNTNSQSSSTSDSEATSHSPRTNDEHGVESNAAGLSQDWFSFDDDDVELIDPACVNNTVVSRSAYILFYKRRN
jgi:ubiquitin carboxyl-terminal hydrolase 4/11/15